jgi:N-acetyl-alpha-D-muramate 1-phosphate uridylyltransferase
MKAMILAAGLGHRMRPLTDHTPKPMLAVGGKPLLQHHLENLAAANITQVVINLAYLGEKIRDFVGDGSRFGLPVSYSQEPEPLETGGALLKALPLLGDEPFLLINGDVWCDVNLAAFTHKTLNDDCLGHLLLVPNPSFHPQGDFALSDSGLLISDPTKTHPVRHTFAGISLLRPSIIRHYPQQRPKFPLGEVLFHSIDNQQLSAELHRGNWCDVGTPERLTALDQRLSNTNRALDTAHALN